MIADLRACYCYPIFVVDDNSGDDTINIAEHAGATVIPLAARLGAWGATQTGLRYAMRQGFDVVISMDADGQHPAETLPSLLEPILAGAADVSIGSCTERGSLARKIAWVLLKRISGLRLEDVTSGLRVYNRRAVKELASWRATLLDYQDVGVLLLLQAKGLQIVDVPVAMRPRCNGHSRVFRSWLIVAYYMCQTLLLGLSKRRRKRRHRHTPPSAQQA
jgi:glycosyltransferase involved in cell wall biosynthesis